ncbi:PH domain-containing protein [Lysobacter olei]
MLTSSEADVPHASAVPHALPDGEWQSLPPRARGLMAFVGALQFALPGVALAFMSGGVLPRVFDVPLTWPLRLGGMALVFGAMAAAGAWLGLRQYRHTHWRHDAQGLALRRGRLWYRETRVPATRVQHLDVTRGPLQRGRDLATLVVHTAGTQHSAVKFPNLDAGDAERLRDVLGRQIDHDDDA